MQRLQAFKYELIQQQLEESESQGSKNPHRNRQRPLRFPAQKATTTISQNHAVVFVEDLQVRNMIRSAAGTAENPGTNVAAKSGLNKAILDQGWGEFRWQLDYKTAWNGGMLFAVPPHHTSQTCPCCGHVSKDNRQTQARFACVECGYENNADVVGAINVLERGHRLLACGEGALRLSMKQEPTEVSQLSS